MVWFGQDRAWYDKIWISGCFFINFSVWAKGHVDGWGMILEGRSLCDHQGIGEDVLNPISLCHPFLIIKHPAPFFSYHHPLGIGDIPLSTT